MTEQQPTREQLRAEIEQQTKEFLANGGKIEVIPTQPPVPGWRAYEFLHEIDWS